jgi:hypothetical protein
MSVSWEPGRRYARVLTFLKYILQRVPQQRKDNPIVTVFEKWPNLADHEKIQGTDHGGFSQHLQ